MTADTRGIPLAPLTGVLDLRSSPDALAQGAMRMRQNMQTVGNGKLRRGSGWTKFLSSPAYNNSDFHDQLLTFTAGGIRQPPTLLYKAESSRKVRSLIVATQGKIAQLNQHGGNYKILGSGYGGAQVASAAAPRFHCASVGDLVAFTNDFDRPKYIFLEESGMPVHDFDDLPLIGLSRAKVIWSWHNCLFLANVEMDSQRVANRLLWSDFQDGTSFDPSKPESITGSKDLYTGEEIIGARPSGNSYLIYTNKGIWEMTLVGGDQSFGFRRVYNAEDNELKGTLAYANTLVNTSIGHLYAAEDGIYRYTQYSTAPERIEWLHLATPILYDQIDKTNCQVHVAGQYGDEVLFSFAKVGDANNCPSVTLRVNLAYGVCDVVDHGFTAFENYDLFDAPTIRDFIVENRICTLAGLNSAGYPYVNEGLPSPVENPIAAFEPQVFYTSATQTYPATIPQSAKVPTTISRASGIATMTLTAHGYSTNDILSVVGMSDPSFNTPASAITILGANSFTYPSLGPDVATTNASAPFVRRGDTAIEGVATVESDGTATVKSKSHGLTTGNHIRAAAPLPGNPTLNSDEVAITVTDADTFTYPTAATEENTAFGAANIPNLAADLIYSVSFPVSGVKKYVASSTDGTKLVVAAKGGWIFTSTNSGTSWTTRDQNRQWRAIASSDNGVKLVAAVENGNLYTSTDSGATWVARDSVRRWTSVATSSDGTKLAATAIGGNVYTSTDSGVTWTARDSVRNWTAVASSADGTKLVAVVTSGNIYTSTNSGSTWTARDSSRAWEAVASSTDGTKLVAAAKGYGDHLYTSTDSGATWTARDSLRQWDSVASSSDGANLVAAATAGSGEFIYTSTDSGATWTARDSKRKWSSVTSSSDGVDLLAAVVDGKLYRSTDSGVTWAETDNRSSLPLDFLITGAVYKFTPRSNSDSLLLAGPNTTLTAEVYFVYDGAGATLYGPIGDIPLPVTAIISPGLPIVVNKLESKQIPTAVSKSDILNPTWNTVTLAAHGYPVGATLQIGGFSDPEFNRREAVVVFANTNTFSYVTADNIADDPLLTVASEAPTSIQVRKLVTGTASVEDWTQSAADSDSLCALMGSERLDDICLKCRGKTVFVAACSVDWCLKQLGDVFCRERCVNPTAVGSNDSNGYTSAVGSYVLDGITSILRPGPGFAYRSNIQCERLEIDYLAVAQSTPLSMSLRIGISMQPADANTDNCGIVWHQHSSKPLKCLTTKTIAQHLADGTQPSLPAKWDFYRTGPVLHFEWTLDGVGGDALFSKLEADMKQIPVNRR